ncbi:hypothetical protein TWF970_002352 [Orbilia oligospora]|uniref:Uncharacterized protein n=1 Tax=Orbilia oligospora TaxID=2813651 RepID=A0A7C8RFT8_ORBOL|nr:hypothetical protein TWF970_002352 [Orbilia oligospora]
MPKRRPPHQLNLLPPSLLLSLLLLLPTTATAIQYPIPASIFKTHSSAGNPILHIQPSFHHSSETKSLLNFKSIFLANPAPDAALEKSLLSDNFFIQDVDGVQVPNFSVDKGKGVLVFERGRRYMNDDDYKKNNNKNNSKKSYGGRVGKDTGEVWVMTFPVLCNSGGGGDYTEKDYTIFRSGAGKTDWEEINLGIRKKDSKSWSPSARYLGRGFMVDDIFEAGDGKDGAGDASSVLSGQERLYSFGGLCIGGDEYLGKEKNDSFSADLWKIENSTTTVEKPRMIKRMEMKRGLGIRQDGGFSINGTVSMTTTTDLESTMVTTASDLSLSDTTSLWSSTATEITSDIASSSESSMAAETTIDTTTTDSGSSTTSSEVQTSIQTTKLATSTTSSTKPTSTAVSSTSTTSAAAKETNRDPSSSLDVSITLPENPPIPEAGFSMTQLKINSTSSENNSQDGMLILGGYTSSRRFVGLGQLAFFSPKSESWSFVSASLSDNDITPRAGHSAVVDESQKRIIVFGGWIGNITRPAKPSMVILKIGDLDSNGWEWDTFNATEEVEGSAPPDDTPLWGHAAILLEGNVMMLTSGFHVKSLDSSGKQMVNQKTWYLNLTSNEWVRQYHYPHEQIPETVVGGDIKKSHRDIALLAGVFGGVALLVVTLAVLFCYARRQEEYSDVSNGGMSNEYGNSDGSDKFDSMDLEYGKKIPTITATRGVESFNPFRRRTRPEEVGALLRENGAGSPELPPPTRAPLRTHMHRNMNQPSHVDMEMVERMRDQQEQRENMLQDSAAPERRRSVRSEMVAWVREWANADAAAQAAEVLTRSKQERVCSGSSRVKKESSALGAVGAKDMYLKPGRAANSTPKSNAATTGVPDPTDRCVTSCSSTYSDGVVSTLAASENYTTPEELPYPVPPMLLSTCQNYEEQSPRNPRLLVGPHGVTAPLPKKMAQEFPIPTLIPRDSLSSQYGGGYNNHYSYSSTQPLLGQAQDSAGDDRNSEGWRDVTPASHFFTNIPLTTPEEEDIQPHSYVKRGKSLQDRIREEMYNPGPSRTDDDCRLSSIVDFYAESKSPTPIPELTEGTDTEDDEGEEGYLVTGGSGIGSSAYDGSVAVEGKGKMVVLTNTTVDEPIVLRSIRMRSNGQHLEQRESFIAPLLSETIAQLREAGGKVEKSNSRSRIPSIGSSIKKRAAAMAATFNPGTQSNERQSVSHSSSIGRRGVLNRLSQTSTASRRAEQSESTALQPQQAEILDINDTSTEILFPKGNDDKDKDRDEVSSMHMNMNDKVVQLVYTAPKGKLRVVNPSPRRVSSGGTDASLGFVQQRPVVQRRVSSSGNYHHRVLQAQAQAHGEGIMRLGSSAARRVGEMD